MNILAVDSVGKVIEIALLCNDKKYKKNLELKMNASEFLLQLIDDILSENSLTLNDLDYLALNIGPGSFTGIRIAMSLFKGFTPICTRSPVSCCPACSTSLPVLWLPRH